MTTEPARLAQVTMYTDGACLGNPGRGGYGVILESAGRSRELSAGYRLTTNNRMEIMAVIAGLEALRKPSAVTVYSDSQYLVNAMSKGWAERWRTKGWMRTETHPAVNADLWARMLDLCKRHVVAFEWVRGHAGHPQNERCDQLSVQAAKGTHLLEDTGYTSPADAQAGAAVQPSLLAPADTPVQRDNRATSVRCDRLFMTVALRDGRELRVPLAWYPPLVQATAGQRHDYLLEDDGRVITFPTLGLRICMDDLLGLPVSATPPRDEK